MSSIADAILSLHGWIALAIVFLGPALEASAFVGVVFPGEIAVLLGGVLAFEGRIPLPAAIAAAILGAVVGDTAGYFIGKRWGRRILDGTLGRIIKRDHLDKAEGYLRRRGGTAVFFGRFTAALRALIPGLAGMSNLPYPTFFTYNLAGGALWGAGFVIAGFLAGASWHQVADVASRVGLLLLGLVVVGLTASLLVRKVRDRGGLVATAPSRTVKWLQRRFPKQAGWLGRRLDPSSLTGFPLTFTVSIVAFAMWLFGGVTQDVVAHEESVRFDPGVERFVVSHRTAWLTTAAKTATWLGSQVGLVPLVLLVAGWFVLRRRDWRSAIWIAAALAGAVALYDFVNVLVERARPPLRFMIGTYPNGSYPSGHATATIAVCIGAAFLLSRRRSTPAKVLLWSAAVFVALMVGASRIYLGAHWLTDVIGGYALGGAWIGLLIAFYLGLVERSRERPRERKPIRGRNATSRRSLRHWMAA